MRVRILSLGAARARAQFYSDHINVFVCVFYVPCVSRDLCSQSSQSTFCLCIIVSTFSRHRFYCFLINQQYQINGSCDRDRDSQATGSPLVTPCDSVTHEYSPGQGLPWYGRKVVPASFLEKRNPFRAPLWSKHKWNTSLSHIMDIPRLL